MDAEPKEQDDACKVWILGNSPDVVERIRERERRLNVFFSSLMMNFDFSGGTGIEILAEVRPISGALGDGLTLHADVFDDDGVLVATELGYIKAIEEGWFKVCEIRFYDLPVGQFGVAKVRLRFEREIDLD